MNRPWLEDIFKGLGLLFVYRMIVRHAPPPPGPDRLGIDEPGFWKSPAAQLAIVLTAAFAVAGAILLVCLIFIGPRMNSQLNIRAFQARMPLSPKNSVPVVDVIPPVPTTQQAAKLKNPLQPTPTNLEAGKVYYAYYCLFCHGETGLGDGPVGVSYTPRPANLTAAKFRTYSDGQLLRAILTGPGHEPVLNYTIIQPHRWPLVLYTRRLAGQRATTSPTTSTAPAAAAFPSGPQTPPAGHCEARSFVLRAEAIWPLDTNNYAFARGGMGNSDCPCLPYAISDHNE